MLFWRIESRNFKPPVYDIFTPPLTVNVTAAEFSLLRELLLAAGRVVSRERLTEQVLGRKMMMFDRSVDVHVSSLRRKLGPEVDGIERIKAIRGVGYMYTVVDGAK